MFFAAIVALLAVSATCAYKTETLLAKHNPHTSYGVQKICQAVEQDSYKPYDESREDFDETTTSFNSFFGGVQSGRRTRQQIKRCCNKYSQYEKKQCLKNVRENYLDDNCDKGINHICCKTEGTSRYTCFTKQSAGGRVSQFDNQQQQFDDDYTTSEQLFQSLKQQERRRRLHQQQKNELVEEELREEIEEDQEQEERYFDNNQFSYLEQRQDQVENLLNRKAARQARQAARQAINVEQEAEEEAREIARNLRQAQRQQNFKLVKSELNSQKAQQVYGDDIRSEFDTESSIFDREQYDVEIEDDEEQQVLAQEIGQQTYQQKKQLAAREARRVAQQIKRQGGSNFEAQQAAQEVYETEKQEAKRQARQLVNQIDENDYETENERFDTIFGEDFQQNGDRRPCSQSERCLQKVSKATQIAAQTACQKNAQRNGHQTSKTCCQSGEIVGQLAGRRDSNVCLPALHLFQQKAQGCGVNHKPQCSQAFVQCCKQQTRQNRVGQQIEQQEEVLDQVLNNQLLNKYNF